MNVSLSQRYICELPSLSSARTRFITAQGPLETSSQQLFPLTSPIEETVSKVSSTCKLKWHTENTYMVYSLILKQKNILTCLLPFIYMDMGIGR